MSLSSIGVYGLGVMGRNLALNLESSGMQVSVYNRDLSSEEQLLQTFLKHEAKGKGIKGCESVKEFTDSLQKPRKILLMVKAGSPVDSVIEQLLPHLSEGDILIDGGNSHFEDTKRRSKELTASGIRYVGMGVSGGETGARHGPSLMPGTDSKTWEMIKPILEPIAARSFDGSKCVTHIGHGGAGHFVKMVHNGIEYADMQFIAEAYDMMSRMLGLTSDEISDVIKEWNKGPHSGYLMEITAEILAVKDDDGSPLIQKILDSAGHKGTGKWTAIEALKQGIPLPGITGAVISRFISSYTDLRQTLSETYPKNALAINDNQQDILTDLHDALLASRIVNHAEGFFLIAETDKQYSWGINLSEIARIWQGGCIIRSDLLKTVASAFRENPELSHLLLSDRVASMLTPLIEGWRKTISRAALNAFPCPGMMASLSYYDSLRRSRLPANLIQAQRDYFGAHTYERTDKPRGEFFHTQWKSDDDS